MKLSTAQQKAICLASNSRQIEKIIPMQQLWAGQGALARLSLLEQATGSAKSLVAKQIDFGATGSHPRGWDTQLSQQRKRRSYEVELNWYRTFGSPINPKAPTPELVYSETSEQGFLLVLEDLAVNYPVRFTQGKEDRPSAAQIRSAIRWLAQFHAQHLNREFSGLWPTGGYWHLETRPDELEAMPESQVKSSAKDLGEQLKSSPYQTLVHGDAKLANFCFDSTGEQTAAVDFQYVGQGPGVKDLMLLLTSVMPDERLSKEASSLVDYYFEQLKTGLEQWQPDVDASDVIASWRPLYAVAWADFHRFLAGWSPGHWKIGRYCQQQTEMALQMLQESESK